ncbi:hypothetical protein BKA93DRAFT_554881 [Sparassis latifolia]
MHEARQAWAQVGDDNSSFGGVVLQRTSRRSHRGQLDSDYIGSAALLIFGPCFTSSRGVPLCDIVVEVHTLRHGQSSTVFTPPRYLRNHVGSTGGRSDDAPQSLVCYRTRLR